MTRAGLAILLACCVGFAFLVNAAATKLADQFDGDRADNKWSAAADYRESGDLQW